MHAPFHLDVTAVYWLAVVSSTQSASTHTHTQKYRKEWRDDATAPKINNLNWLNLVIRKNRLRLRCLYGKNTPWCLIMPGRRPTRRCVDNMHKYANAFISCDIAIDYYRTSDIRWSLSVSFSGQSEVFTTHALIFDHTPFDRWSISCQWEH